MIIPCAGSQPGSGPFVQSTQLDQDKAKWYNTVQKDAGSPRNGRTKGMKDRPDRAARLQLIGRMFAGQS